MGILEDVVRRAERVYCSGTWRSTRESALYLTSNTSDTVPCQSLPIIETCITVTVPNSGSF